MTTLKQIEANRLNALKSTGPRTPEGKGRSRLNALRHGLTSDVVVIGLESAGEYQEFESSISAEYQPITAIEQVLVNRLASLLWRLRRSAKIETGLFQIESDSQQDIMPPRRPRPEWGNESGYPPLSVLDEKRGDDNSEKLAGCYLRASRFGYNTFDLLGRYECALWRQAAQIIFMLRSVSREKKLNRF